MSQFSAALEKIFVHKDKPLPLRLLIYAAYLVPPIAVAVLTWHDLTQADLDWASTEITRPHDAYQRQPAAGMPLWRPKPSYETAFFSEFSKAYFGHASRWPIFAPGMETATLTVILKNTAESRSMLVSSISVVATLEDETPFDWRKLDVDAALAVAYDDSERGLKFLSQGIGPILDLKAEIKTAQGLELVPHEISYLRDESWAPLTPAKDFDGYRPLAHYEGHLSEPVYRRLAEGETLADGADVVDCNPTQLEELLAIVPDGVEPRQFVEELGIADLEPVDYRCDYASFERFEAIRSLERLRQLTEVHEASAVEVDYSFEDLKGQPSSGHATVGLPNPLVWYRYQEDLSLEVTPQLVPTSGEGAAGAEGGGGSGAVSQAIALAKAFFGVSADSPKGVGLIKSEHKIPAAMPECAFAQSIAEPRELLQGAGYISISVDIEQPRNGRYLLRFLVNGKERHALRIDMLAPDDLEYDDWDDMDRFKADRPDEPAADCGPVETADEPA